MKWSVSSSTIAGSIGIPGDKSIAHRALMLSALAPGVSHVADLPSGQDVLATARCIQALGATVVFENGRARIDSDGELREPSGPLVAANSGTTMRLLAGILAGQPFTSRVVGDRSLSRRPMQRVADPLTAMGATIRTRDGCPPLDIQGGRLHGIDYALPIASAQVKSAILLAGLFASGTTRVIEPAPTRDHTERLFQAVGIDVLRENSAIAVVGGQRPRSFELIVPGDLSSAAFFLSAAAVGGSEVTVRGVGVNPTRTGFLRVLLTMGAQVVLENEREELGEPIADVRVCGPVRLPAHVCGMDVPLLIDEVPLLALLGAHASGITVVRDAGELRHKETDRIDAVVESLSAMGANIRAHGDGFDVEGPVSLHGAHVQSYGDHRLAMMLAVAGSVARGTTIIEEAEACAVSFPDFADRFISLGGCLEAV